MWRGLAMCCHTTQGPRLGIRVPGLGALGGSYRMGGSISHSSLATSSGAMLQCFWWEPSLSSSPKAQQKGMRDIREVHWYMQNPWSWLGERCKETRVCPVLQHRLYMSPLWQGQQEQSLIHATLAWLKSLLQNSTALIHFCTTWPIWSEVL